MPSLLRGKARRRTVAAWCTQHCTASASLAVGAPSGVVDVDRKAAVVVSASQGSLDVVGEDGDMQKVVDDIARMVPLWIETSQIEGVEGDGIRARLAGP